MLEGKVLCRGGGFLFWGNGVKEFPFPFSTWLTHPSVPSPYFSARNNLEANGVIMCGLFQMENAHLSTSDLNQTRGQFSPLQSLPQRLMSFCQVCLAWAPHLWHVSAGWGESGLSSLTLSSPFSGPETEFTAPESQLTARHPGRWRFVERWRGLVHSFTSVCPSVRTSVCLPLCWSVGLLSLFLTLSWP